MINDSLDDNIEVEILGDEGIEILTDEDSVIIIENDDGTLLFPENKSNEVLDEREACAQVAELWPYENGEFIAQKIRERQTN